jgi:DNA-binding SARP family transcriptional activator
MDPVAQVGGTASQRHEPPRLAPAMILRGRLIQPLRGRFERRLTVLEAGAGFGKSTLLAQAVRENRIEQLGLDVWLRVDERDRSGAQLRRGLGDALELDVDDPTIDQLVDAVWGRAPASVALIVDDVHRLGDEAEGWAVLTDLLERLPANGHLVLSGRRSPLVPVARLQSADDAVVLDESELAFTDDELAAVAELRAIPPGLALELPRWPALATLTGVVGRQASIEYLWDEVLAALPADRQRLLAAVAPFAELDDGLVGALGGECTAAELVADLPLVETTEAGTLRLHDLWVEALLATADPAAHRDALAVGGRFLLERGELVRAAEAFAAAGDEHGVEAVVLAFARQPSMRSSTPQIDRLAAALPASMRARPSARYLEAARHYATDDRQATVLFARAADAAQAAGELELETIARWRVVQFDDLDVAGGPQVIPRLEELAAAEVPSAAAVVAFVEARQAQTAGDPERAQALLAGLDGFDDDQRLMSRAIRLIDLGRPEALPATLDSVLSASLSDIYEAQAVWLQGMADPESAWALARELTVRSAHLAVITRVSVSCVVSVIGMTAGAHDEARALADDAARSAPAVALTVGAFTEVAAALCDLVTVGEEACVAALTDLLERVPLGRWPERPYLYALAVLRGLVPGGEVLDECRFGPSLSVAVQAGAALAALRAGDEGPARALPWEATDLLRAHVPPPLLAELALAAADVPAASGVLERLPHRRTWLRRIADRPDGPLRQRAASQVRSLPARPAYDLHVGVLGGLSLLRSDGRATDGWDRRERVRHLLGHLALHRDVHRADLAALLWPDLPAEKAAANLRVNLHHLQAALQPERADDERPWFLQVDQARLTLAVDGVTVDAEQVDQAMADAVRAEAAGLPSEALRHYQRVGELYVGDLLPDLDAEWVLYERLRLRSVAHAAAARHGELVLARGEPEAAMRLAVRAQRLDPLSERAQRLFIRCHLALGSVTAARQSALHLRRTLADADLEPERETEILLGKLDA